jgi:protein SCO1/2
MKTRLIAGLATIAAAISVWAFVAGSTNAHASNLWGANYFPNVELIDQNGQKYRFYDDLLKNKTVLINFIYTKCGDSCPLETAKLRQVQRVLGERVGKDVFFYSISIDPQHDTPETLSDYAENYNAGPGWLFLTGKKEDVDQIRRKLGVQNRPGSDPLTGHSTTLTMGNEATGQWMIDSTMDDPKYIAAMVGDWLSSWKYHKKSNPYQQKPAVMQADMDRGKHLFKTRCAACHSVGGGDGVGPDLMGVTSARDERWVARMIGTPDEMLKSDPIAKALYEKYRHVKMPNLRLDGPDVVALIDFLNSAGKQAPAR